MRYRVRGSLFSPAKIRANLDTSLRAVETDDNEIAEPFAWNFTREKLNVWVARLNARATESTSLAAW